MLPKQQRTTLDRSRPGHWTGPLMLDIRNGRDWAAGTVEVSLGRDTVTVRHQGRMLAVLDRDRFRRWLMQVQPHDALAADEVVWSVQAGVTCMSVGPAVYTVTRESLANLVTVV